MVFSSATSRNGRGGGNGAVFGGLGHAGRGPGRRAGRGFCQRPHRLRHRPDRASFLVAGRGAGNCGSARVGLRRHRPGGDAADDLACHRLAPPSADAARRAGWRAHRHIPSALCQPGHLQADGRPGVDRLLLFHAGRRRSHQTHRRQAGCGDGGGLHRAAFWAVSRASPALCPPSGPLSRAGRSRSGAFSFRPSTARSCRRCWRAASCRASWARASCWPLLSLCPAPWSGLAWARCCIAASMTAGSTTSCCVSCSHPARSRLVQPVSACHISGHLVGHNPQNITGPAGDGVP